MSAVCRDEYEVFQDEVGGNHELVFDPTSFRPSKDRLSRVESGQDTDRASTKVPSQRYTYRYSDLCYYEEKRAPNVILHLTPSYRNISGSDLTSRHGVPQDLFPTLTRFLACQWVTGGRVLQVLLMPDLQLMVTVYHPRGYLQTSLTKERPEVFADTFHWKFVSEAAGARVPWVVPPKHGPRPCQLVP